jgi:hypothetical protein
MTICWVADLLHKTPDEIRAMTVADFDAICAHFRIKHDKMNRK